MKDLVLYFLGVLGAVAILVGLPLLVLLVLRRKVVLWRVLFAAEAVLLFISFGNCFGPGPWKDFWISESIDWGLALAASLSSVLIRKRTERDDIPLIMAPQQIAFYVVTGIIAAMVITH